MRIIIHIKPDIHIDIDTEDKYVDEEHGYSSAEDETSSEKSSLHPDTPAHTNDFQTISDQAVNVQAAGPPNHRTYAIQVDPEALQKEDQHSVSENGSLRNAGSSPSDFSSHARFSPSTLLNRLVDVSITDDQTELAEILIPDLVDHHIPTSTNQIEDHPPAMKVPDIVDNGSRGLAESPEEKIFDGGSASIELLRRYEYGSTIPDQAVTYTNDLTKIEGIGPRFAQLLYQANIRTFKDLMNCSVMRLRSILRSASLSADPTTWAEQASLAVEGKWEALEQLQEELKGGRRISTDV